MTAVPFLLSSSALSNFAPIRTTNVHVEANPASQAAPVALVARPGLSTFASVGTAPTRALWQKQGLFENAALIVASGEVISLSASAVQNTYSGTSIAGDDLVEIDGQLDADYNSEAYIANGSAFYKAVYNPLTATRSVVQITFPDAFNAGATSVGCLSGYVLATQAGSDAVYYQIPAASTFTALQFASAEYAPDANVCIRVVGDIAWLMGETTLEGWRATGSSTSPLEPVGGLKFDVGCKTKAAAVNCRGTLVFVDSDGSVRMTSGGAPETISEKGLAEQIGNTAVGDIRASFYIKDQRPIYRLTLAANGSWDYDLSAGKWTQANSYGYAYARAHLFANIGDMVLAADSASNAIWTVDPDSRLDVAETFTVEFHALLEVKEGRAPIGNLELDCLLGDAPHTGQGSAPLISLQISKDGGYTFGPIQYRSLGVTGSRLTAPRWNALGDAVAPFGALFKFQVSDPVGRRFSGARINVP